MRIGARITTYPSFSFRHHVVHVDVAGDGVLLDLHVRIAVAKDVLLGQSARPQDPDAYVAYIFLVLCDLLFDR